MEAMGRFLEGSFDFRSAIFLPGKKDINTLGTRKGEAKAHFFLCSSFLERIFETAFITEVVTLAVTISSREIVEVEAALTLSP
jgi:hypothetical protein